MPATKPVTAAPSRQRRESRQANRVAERQRWFASTAAIGIVGAVLMWLSMPPVDWGWLGWLAPVCWLLLIRRPTLSGRRPYWTLYFVGWLYYGVTFYWVTLPHVTAILGWAALTTYLALYVVLFVGLSRVAVHRLRIPILVAAPVVWTGLELVRAHFATGLLMAALAHTQYRWLSIIQISDIVGAYGLSFLIMFVASCLAMMVPWGDSPARLWPLAPAALAIVAAATYGQIRMSDVESREGPKVALIQGNIDTQFDVDYRESQRQTEQEYFALTKRALSEHSDIDLVVWPESMCTVPLVTIDEGAWLPAAMVATSSNITMDEAKRLEANQRLPQMIYEMAEASRNGFRILLTQLTAAGIPGGTEDRQIRMLVGVNGLNYGRGRLRRYNTSLYLNPAGEPVAHYNKMHRVMFGEYIPLGDYFPLLYALTPLPGGLTAGTEPQAYDIAGYRLAPNICYETILPHVIRRQVVMLQDAGRDPDILVTQTNDGWFWGSPALDMHLICGVFRSVECRKPLIIAANTGFSASINADGQIEQQGPRHAPDVLVVRPQTDSRQSLYLATGDWFAQLCAAFCLAICMVVIVARFRGRTGRPDGTP